MGEQAYSPAPLLEADADDWEPADKEVKPSLEEIPGGQSADVEFTVDIYDSVVVSAFGGLTQNLAKDASMLVHPLLMLLLVFPVFVAQFNCILFLRLTQDLKAPIVGEVHGRLPFEILSEPNDVDVPERMLLCMKLLMVIILQLLLFGKISCTVRLLVFIGNPTTWTDIRRPDPSDMKMRFASLFRSPALLPCAFISIALKLFMIYLVCVDSLSIILGSRSVSEVILDSLSAIFIADLGEFWWQCVAAIFHLDRFDDYEFKVESLAIRKKTEARSWLPTVSTTGPLRFLHRGRGARAFEIVLTFTLMTTMYFRQLLVVLQALDTNILPLARDVCTIWRWDSGKSKHLTTLPMLFQAIEKKLIVIDPSSFVDQVANPERGGYCTKHYGRLQTSDELKQIKEHDFITLSFICFFFMFMIFPQVFYAFNAQIRKICYQKEDLASDQFEQSAQKKMDAKADVERLMNENEDLKTEVNNMQDWLHNLLGDVASLKSLKAKQT